MWKRQLLLGWPYRRMHNLPANLPSVTGATSAVSLGAIFQRNKPWQKIYYKPFQL